MSTLIGGYLREHSVAPSLPMDPRGRHLRTAARWGVKALAIYVTLWVVVNGGILLVSKYASMRTPVSQESGALATLPHLEHVDGRLWRSAAPSTDAQYRALRARGVTTVVDLRQLSTSQAHGESIHLARLGLHLVVIPIPDGGIPKPHQVQTFLGLFQTVKGQVLVHCGAGVGRTGTMVSAWLVSTGQATGPQAMMRSLAVGPPSVQQLAFEYDLSRYGDFSQPHLDVRVVSRIFDEPRLLFHAL